MMPTLSILVCSLECRKHFLDRLKSILEPQLNDRVQLLIDVDNGEVPIGRKRNRLVLQSCGKYVCFIDDDDTVTDDYVETILRLAEADADCIGFKVRRTIDGGEEDLEAVHSMRWEAWTLAAFNNRPVYARTPNHLNPIRRSIAIQAPFPELNMSEDAEYSKAVRPLLHSEAFIDKALYVYEYRSHRPDEVTNAINAVTINEAVTA